MSMMRQLLMQQKNSGEWVELELNYPGYFLYCKNVGDKYNGLQNITSFDSGVFDCKEGDMFRLTGKGGNGNSRLYSFFDSSNICLAIAKGNETETDLIVTAPENAVKFGFCAYNTSAYKLEKWQ